MIFEARPKVAPQSRGADRPSHRGFLPLFARMHAAPRRGAASRGEDRGRPRRRGGARPRRARALMK